MGFGSKRGADVEDLIRDAPRKSQANQEIGGAVLGACAPLFLALAAITSDAQTAVYAVLCAAAFAGLSIWSFWGATKFRIAQDAARTGSALVLTGSGWSVTLQPGDVKQVVQLHTNPHPTRGYNPTLAAWGVWIRVDAAAGGMRRRRYLAMRADAPAFIEQLRDAGFPVVGDVTPVP